MYRKSSAGLVIPTGLPIRVVFWALLIGVVSAFPHATAYAAPDAPIALPDDRFGEPVGDPVVVDVLSNDVPDGADIDPSTVRIVDPDNLSQLLTQVVIDGEGVWQVNTATGTITFRPDISCAGVFRDDPFPMEYTVGDGDGLRSNPAIVDISFDPNTTARPLLQDDQANTRADQAVIIDVLANDCDPDGDLDPALVTVLGAPSFGAAVPNANGTITYTPNGVYSGPVQFTYQVCDADSTDRCSSASVNVAVEPLPVNQPPIVVSDSPPDIVFDQAITIAVLDNDSDPDGVLDKNSVTVKTPAGHGNAVPATDGSGTIVYTPTSGYSGDDQFTYEVCDDGIPAPVKCGEANVFLTVLPPDNLAPTANDDQAETRQNRAVPIPVLSNDRDPEDALNPASVQVTDGPASGQVSIDTASGNITYTPNQDFIGSDTFKYTVCDLATPPLCSNKATVAIVVSPPLNQPPNAVDDNAVTQQDVPVTVNVLGNDGDPEGALNPNSVAVTSTPANGQATKNADNTITYTPTLNFHGGDAFTYQVCDSATTPLCDTATVNIVVLEPVNEPPVAVNDGAVTFQGKAVTIPVLDNDEDPEGNLNPATVQVAVPGPANGQTQVDSTTGYITYTPTLSFVGNDTFDYEVCDGAAAPLCDSATVAVTVAALPNQAPVAVNDNASTRKNQSVSISVLDNDRDPDGVLDSTSLTVTIAAGNGQSQVITDTITYTPAVDFVGSDSFSYAVCDSAAVPLCDTAMVSIAVVEPSTENVVYAFDDEIAGFLNQAINGNVLTNDSYSGGAALQRPTMQTPPIHGEVNSVNGVNTFNDDGSFTYMPDSNYLGGDSFLYQLCDDGIPQACDTATVTVTVGMAANVPPIAIDDAAVTRPDLPITINVLANDVDLDGELVTSTLAISGTVTPGSARVVNGTIEYTPDAETAGEVHFEYEICDDGVPSACDTATVTINIRATPNRPPIAVDDNAATLLNQPVEIAVLANDVDLDGGLDPNSLSLVTSPANGQATFDNGLATYTPNQDFSGSDSFVYQVCDSHSLPACATATARILVIAPTEENEAYAFNDAAYVRAGESVVGNVLSNDLDPEADGWQAPTVETSPSQGAVELNVDGSFRYTATLTFVGNDSWTYRVCDLGVPEACAGATVLITVGPANVRPIAVDDWAVTRINTQVSGNLLVNDADPDGDMLAVDRTPTIEPSSGQVVLTTDGHFTYTPDPGATGPDTFTYQVCDPYGLCDTADVTVDVRALNMANAAPYAADDRAITRPGVPVTIVVLANDGDLDGVVNPASLSVVSGPNHGTAGVKANGTILYTPAPGINDAVSFSYRACDNGEPVLCAMAAVAVEISAAGSNTTYAFDDTGWGRNDRPLKGNVLANDLDLEGNIQTVDVNATGLPSHGQLTLAADGAYVFTPEAGYIGADQFTYRVCDDGVPQSCATAKATLQIFPPTWAGILAMQRAFPQPWQQVARVMPLSPASTFAI